MRGRSLNGKRLQDTAPFGGWTTQTFIAGLRHSEMIAPVLNPGDVVILHNLSSHKREKATKALKDVGCWFLILELFFSLTAGEGIGRYIGLNTVNGAALNPQNGELEAIPSVGGLLAWRHPFGETARFNLGYSGLFVDNPVYIANSATESVQSVYGAVLWEIAPGVTVGTELMFGERKTEAGADGDMTRFTFSTKYAF